ncbi:hypothetical protein, partial [Pseudoflavonifractor hominis]|uniref:hypothetical protein n=1 Tax=Pseudoflavonifractor hominis TaxID=2763059 RepID=UPI001A9B70C0
MENDSEALLWDNLSQSRENEKRLRGKATRKRMKRQIHWGNPKFCVTAKSGANRVKFIMGGRRVKRLPPCLQHNASGT